MTDLPGGGEPQDLDLSAIAADDAMLDRLAAGDVTGAFTWDGTIDEPTEITDAVIWTDEPVQRPPSTPVKKGRSSLDPAEKLLAIVRADVELGLAAAIDNMCVTPGVTWGTATTTVPAEEATPGVIWGRFARRTGTRGAAALAAVAVSLGGVAAASVSAGPGNPLYPVHKLFAGPDIAHEQTYAAGQVSRALDETQAALDDGKAGRAHGKLTVAEARLKKVDAGQVRDALVKRHDSLAVLVAAALTAEGKPTPSPTDTSKAPVVTPTPTISSGSTPTTLPTLTPTPTVSLTPTPSSSEDNNGKDGKGGDGKSDDGKSGDGKSGDGKSGDGKGDDGTDGKDPKPVSSDDATPGTSHSGSSSGHGKPTDEPTDDETSGKTTGPKKHKTPTPRPTSTSAVGSEEGSTDKTDPLGGDDSQSDDSNGDGSQGGSD